MSRVPTFTCTRSGDFTWTVRDTGGRVVARAPTRAGARAAIRHLHDRIEAQARPGLSRDERRALIRAQRATALAPARWRPADRVADHG